MYNAIVQMAERVKDSKDGLHFREQRILQASLDYFLEYANWPTFRELSVAIADEVKIDSKGKEVGVSTSMINRYLNNLQWLGYWERDLKSPGIGRITVDGANAILENGTKVDQKGYLFNLVDRISSDK